MSELWLRVEKNLDGDELPGSVYAELSGTGITGARRFMIPVGLEEKWHREDVQPGQFLIQVRLPSGAVICQDVTVTAEAVQPVRVVIEPEPSAHEHLAWPQLLGSVDVDLGEAAFTRRVSSERLEVRGFPRFAETGLRFELCEVGPEASLSPAVTLTEGVPVRIGQRGLDLPSVDYVLWLRRDEESLVLQFQPTDSPRTVNGLEGQIFLRNRIFLQVRGLPGLPRLVSLPLPWYRTIPHLWPPPPLQLDVLLHQPTPHNTPPTSAVIIRDGVMGPLLAYLQTGQLTAVQAMRDMLLYSAEGLLYHKRVNPYAAAAGALVLLRTRQYERLHDWPLNLVEWFPWLSDGAVIYAWCCLSGVHHWSGEPRRPDPDKARSYLIDAVGRGVPVYSGSLKLLIDGLIQCRALADSKGRRDDEVREALAKMREYAVAIDWDQPFTTFPGEDPLNPQA